MEAVDCPVICCNPGLCSIEQFAQYQRLQELRPLLQWQLPVAKKKLSVLGDCSMGNADTAPDFISLISLVMNKASQMSVARCECHFKGAVLVDHWQGSARSRSVQKLFVFARFMALKGE